MEQNNMEQTLTKDQINRLAQDIITGIKITLDEKVETTKNLLDIDCVKFIDDEIKQYEEIHKLYGKLEKLCKEYNDKIDVISDSDNGLLDSWDNKFCYANLPSLEELKQAIKASFYKNNYLASWHTEQLLKVVEVKIKAILCTLETASYENITKVVLDKLNLNDLFDNRQKYLN